MGAVVGYGVALQASCLEGFDSLGFHHITGCIVSQVRRPALEVGGRRFESYHPDQFKDVNSKNLYIRLLI